MAAYAVIRTGGKQYQVKAGGRLTVEKIDAEAGSQIALQHVLLVKGEGGETVVGAPLVENASVLATVTRQGRADKILVHKYRRRKNSRRTIGHRQWLTELRIDEIRLASPELAPPPAGPPGE
jgi:large subunit ribosomal protein L21